MRLWYLDAGVRMSGNAMTMEDIHRFVRLEIIEFMIGLFLLSEEPTSSARKASTP